MEETGVRSGIGAGDPRTDRTGNRDHDEQGDERRARDDISGSNVSGDRSTLRALWCVSLRLAAQPCLCHDRGHMPVRTYPIRHPLDLRLTLAPLRRGPYDPTIRLATGRVWRATRTADGPASVALVHAGDQLRAEAWGPGADRLLADIPALLGLDDDAAPVPIGHPLIA